MAAAVDENFLVPMRLLDADDGGGGVHGGDGAGPGVIVPHVTTVHAAAAAGDDRAAKLASFTGQIITLNIGGTRFSTSLATLTAGRAAGSFMADCFTAHVSTLPRQPDGSVFIDRDAESFAQILLWLRTGTTHDDPIKRATLMAESKYWELAGFQANAFLPAPLALNVKLTFAEFKDMHDRSMGPHAPRLKNFSRVLFTCMPILGFDFTGYVFDHCAFVDVDLAGSQFNKATFKVCTHTYIHDAICTSLTH